MTKSLNKTLKTVLASEDACGQVPGNARTVGQLNMTNEDLIKRATVTSCLAAHHLGEAMKLPPSLWPPCQFDRINLWLREASSAVNALQSRAKGNPAPKIGDL